MPTAHLINSTLIRITANDDFHQGVIFQASIQTPTGVVELEPVRQEGEHYYYHINYQAGVPVRLKVNNGYDVPVSHLLWYDTDEFSVLFDYDGPLGPDYSKRQTVFRLWAPTATAVAVRLFQTPQVIVPLERGDKGVWTTTIKQDLANTEYTYVIEVEGSWKEAIDPYAWMNTQNSTRSMVIDSKILDFDDYRDIPEKKQHTTECVIYELSVRDYSMKGAQLHKGKYLAFEEQAAYDLRYIRDLHVTHIQLMPVFDFGSVWDEDPLFYNWGYDPVQHNTVEGSFATNPNAVSKLTEFKRMVKAIHNHGLRVVMDVVFNHTFIKDQYMWDQIIPGYFFRHQDTRFSNGSFCGNDIETRRMMSRRYIIDSCVRFVDTFGIDGFRFDLMGLIDQTTMNQLRTRLNEIDPSILLYGEGWQMYDTLASQHELATIVHHRVTPGVGYFNDLFREKVKRLDELHLVYDMLAKRNQYISLTQSVNYTECHDNETLFDFLEGDFEKHQLMTMLTILAPGIPFLHAGQEFFRTKNGVENSYCSPDEINALDWARADRYRIYTDFVRGLLEFRKLHPSLTHPDAHVSMFEEQGLKIFQYDFLDDQVRLVVNLSNRKIARQVDAALYSHQIEARNIHLQEIHAYSAVVL